MIRFILAVIGILLIAFGGQTGFKLGFYCLLPAILTIVWKFGSKIHQWYKLYKYRKEREKEANDAYNAEQAKKREKLKQQADLFERYKKSPVTAEVLRYICGTNTSANLPTHIYIYNNRIESKVEGTVRTYNFAQHRLPSLEYVWGHADKLEDLKYVVRPQIALAEAINVLLSNQYKIFDDDNISYRQCHHSDGDVSTYISYSSDHVTMVLKQTLPNRNF